MLIWQQNLLKKFEEKFPEYYEGCKDSNWHFLRSSNMCSSFNSKLNTNCLFTYKSEHEFSIELKQITNRR